MRKKVELPSNNLLDSEESSYDPNEPEAISVRCPFFIKEHVDCKDKDDRWRNGEIIKVNLLTHSYIYLFH